MQDTQVADSFRWKSNREKNYQKCMLCLLPWFLLNFPPKLISNNLYVKGVSEQHMESECLLQQPEEEDHWIQSLEPLPAP